jgi:carbon monoxide dehydrogenase subunit G
MILRNEFVVAAPLEQTWQTLLDVPRVASALPGATIEPGGNGDYRGSMRLKIGPVTAEVTASSVDKLELVVGGRAVASFKATGTRLVYSEEPLAL